MFTDFTLSPIHCYFPCILTSDILYTTQEIILSFFHQFSSLESLSHVQLFAIPWTVAHQAPLSMEFSRQEYWSELPFPTLGDLPTQGLNLCLLLWQADSLPLCHLRS